MADLACCNARMEEGQQPQAWGKQPDLTLYSHVCAHIKQFCWVYSSSKREKKVVKSPDKVL